MHTSMTARVLRAASAQVTRPPVLRLHSPAQSYRALHSISEPPHCLCKHSTARPAFQHIRRFADASERKSAEQQTQSATSPSDQQAQDGGKAAEGGAYVPNPLTDREGEGEGDAEKQKAIADAIAERKKQQPSYQIWFTCRYCLTRSNHNVSKQAYHFGTCLINCPGCQKRHLISDHLRIFSDNSVTIEDILREKGETIRKGRLGDDSTNVEFYADDATENLTKPRGTVEWDDPPAANEPEALIGNYKPQPPRSGNSRKT